MDYTKAAIYLRLTSRQEFHRLKSCGKEPWTVSWVERHLQPGQVLYDVGANIGAYTLVGAVTVPEARVVAFEPSPANFAALCANLELNAVADRVTPIPLALGDRARSANLGGDAAVPGASPHVDQAATSAAKALVDRLDDVIERYGLPPANHLKLDVDGAELDVLAGAERTLGDASLSSLMVELDREREEGVVNRLRAFGFDLAERAAGRDRSRSMPTYGLFLRA